MIYLTEYLLWRYCGHFNGSHFLSPEDISSLRVVALPLLFGCSSVALQDLGGQASPTGVSDKYIMAGRSVNYLFQNNQGKRDWYLSNNSTVLKYCELKRLMNLGFMDWKYQ